MCTLHHRPRETTLSLAVYDRRALTVHTTQPPEAIRIRSNTAT